MLNLNKLLKKKLCIKYSQEWRSNLFNDKRGNNFSGNKLRTYRIFKNTFRFEKYLSTLSLQQRVVFTRFRIGSHKLEIEKGRYFNTAPENRICKLCNNGVEDEIHYLLTCSSLSNIRDPILNQILFKNPNLKDLDKQSLFLWLMSNENKCTLVNVCQLLIALNVARTNILDNNVNV